MLLLDKQRFPRDKSCGDGLTRASVRLLAEMEILPALRAAQAIRGVRVCLRGRGSRDFDYPAHLAEPNHGLVVPRFELDATVTPTPVNPLGAKGVGEAGTLGSTPSVVSAVVDALSPFGVKHVDMMLRPEKLWRIMQQGARPSSGQGGRS